MEPASPIPRWKAAFASDDLFCARPRRSMFDIGQVPQFDPMCTYDLSHPSSNSAQTSCRGPGRAHNQFDLITGSSGKPGEMLGRVGVENIGYVQFCDTDGTPRDGGTSKHLACGEGHVDCAKSLKALRDGGFRGWIMVDEWEVPDPYDPCIKRKVAIDQAWGV